jgi:hypothetical protein
MFSELFKVTALPLKEERKKKTGATIGFISVEGKEQGERRE